jgi:protein-S-isoprenylcysteine O-methyltransferase Ste14
MYVGIILFILCFPLALGSLYSFIPALIIVILFVIRTSLEDKTLQEELEGYQEYARRVRYKLIPGIY